VVPSCSDPIDLYCDNSGAITQAEEPRSHQKSRHTMVLSFDPRNHRAKRCEDMQGAHRPECGRSIDKASPSSEARGSYKGYGHEMLA
jgi:hypothetical protein